MNLIIFKKFGTKFLRWGTAAAVLVFIGYIVSLSFLHFASPYLQEHNQKITDQISVRFAHPVKIGAINATKFDLQPIVILHDVTIFNIAGTDVLCHLDDLRIGISVWSSLWHGRLIENSIGFKGAKIFLQTDANGNISIGDLNLKSQTKLATAGSINDPQAAMNNKNSEFLLLFDKLSAYKRITLDDISLIWRRATGDTIKVNNMEVRVINNIIQHTIVIRGKLEQRNSVMALVVAKLNFSGKLSDFAKVAIAGEVSVDGLNFDALSLHTSVNAVSAIADKDKVVNKNKLKDSERAWCKFLPQNAKIKLNIRNSTFLWTKWFDTPLDINDFTANLSWQNLKQNLKLQVTDISVELPTLIIEGNKAVIDWSKDHDGTGAPDVDLQLEFMAEHLEKLHEYFPAKIMSPNLMGWLTRAFSAQGDVDGKLTLHGNLANFPFVKNNDGIFKIAINLHNVDLLFNKDWPVINNINGQALFTGKTMWIDASYATTMRIQLYPISVKIEDLTKPELKINGQAHTTSTLAKSYIGATPLINTLGHSLSHVDLHGGLMLDLNLFIPLEHSVLAARALGTVHLKNNGLFVPAWNMEMQNINGEINFDGNALTSNNLHGMLLDKDINLNINSNTPMELKVDKNANVADKSQEKVTQITFASKFPITVLQQQLAFPLSDYVQGDIAYHGLITLPSQKGKNISLDLFSDLLGVTINMPPLIVKSANVMRNFKAHFDFADNFTQPQIMMQYGDKISAALSFAHSKEHAVFKSGELRFGEGLAEIPSMPGLFINGNLDNVDWAAWQKILFNEKAATVTAKAADTIAVARSVITGSAGNANTINKEKFFSARLINKINLKIGELHIWGHVLPHLSITVVSQDNAWLVNLQNSVVSGSFAIPHNLAREAVIINLQKLYLPDSDKNKKEAKADFNPKELPPLQIAIGDFHYGNKVLGQVELQTTPNDHGLRIDKFKINASNFQLDAIGKWEKFGGFVQSAIQGMCTSKNFGAALKQLHSTDNLANGAGAANFALTWQNPFYDPTAATMDGNVSVSISSGRIVNLESTTEAEVGIGRLLSILGLQTLPRRLSLDFSDLLKNGFSFDVLKGSFKLVSGDAYTNDTEVNGPVAEVKVRGRIGFAKKDYDMNLTVVPHVTASLPVIATVAGGPIVGAVTWVADKLIGGEVKRVINYVYKVQGGWVNPIIRPLP